MEKTQNGKEKKRRGVGRYLYISLIAVLAALMLFSGCKVLSIVLDYSRGEGEYNEIADSFVLDYTTVRIPKKDTADTEDIPDTNADTQTFEVSDTTNTSVSDVPVDTTSDEPAPEDDLLVIPNIDSEYLMSVNPDYKGWLYIDGIVINYPVVQCGDNDYYLDHTFYGQQNPNGCLFLDYRHDLSRDNYNTLIYGHAMKTGAMFGLLLRYAWPGFFEENQHIV